MHKFVIKLSVVGLLVWEGLQSAHLDLLTLTQENVSRPDISNHLSSAFSIYFDSYKCEKQIVKLFLLKIGMFGFSEFDLISQIEGETRMVHHNISVLASFGIANITHIGREVQKLFIW